MHRDNWIAATLPAELHSCAVAGFIHKPTGGVLVKFENIVGMQEHEPMWNVWWRLTLGKQRVCEFEKVDDLQEGDFEQFAAALNHIHSSTEHGKHR